MSQKGNIVYAPVSFFGDEKRTGQKYTHSATFVFLFCVMNFKSFEFFSSELGYHMQKVWSSVTGSSFFLYFMSYGKHSFV